MDARHFLHVIPLHFWRRKKNRSSCQQTSVACARHLFTQCQTRRRVWRDEKDVKLCPFVQALDCTYLKSVSLRPQVWTVGTRGRRGFLCSGRDRWAYADRLARVFFSLPLHSLSSPQVTDRVMKHVHTRQGPRPSSGCQRPSAIGLRLRWIRRQTLYRLVCTAAAF
jgi:hypothetical protein